MRLTTTLCGLVLSLGLAAQKPADKPIIPVKPVTEDYHDFSSWKTIDPELFGRFQEMRKYPIPQHQSFVDEVASAILYLDAVKVPDWEAILPPRDTANSPISPLLFSGDGNIHTPNSLLADAAHFYFLNGSNELFPSDTADIKTMMDYHLLLRERGLWSGLSPYDTTLRFTVEGRADKSPFAGRSDESSDHENYLLSESRALAVAGAMRKLYPQAEIELRAFGNAKSVCEGDDTLSLALNRVVRVIPGKTALECALEQVPANYTILDGSYSMTKNNGSGYPPLEIVMLYPYENGNVFFFSNRGGVWKNGKYGYNHPEPDDTPMLLTKYTPAFEAQTPLKEVMLYVAMVADPGTSFRFITDGYPSSTQVEYDHVITVAQRRNITFSFIGTGPYDAHFDELKKVASATGGQTYFACHPSDVLHLSQKK